MRAAWEAALYGPAGFYRREQPADHFRTSAHVSGGFAEAMLAVARAHGAETVVDVGAGAGELLAALRVRDRHLGLVGIDVRPRPPTLPSGIGWGMSEGDPAALVADAASGPTLLVANELLDNIPCEVVELAPDGLREVEVDAVSGRERLGGEADLAASAWVERWWPLETPGQRAVVGLARDTLWSRLCGAVGDGVGIAVDFGHTRADRPTTETPTSYRNGRQHHARFDGRHDVTAYVAVDSVASAVGARLDRQRSVISQTVPRPAMPSRDLAHADPVGYLRSLSGAGRHRELTASPGLGDFWWIVSPCGRRAAPDGMGAIEPMETTAVDVGAAR
jgi:hypothetical protein